MLILECAETTLPAVPLLNEMHECRTQGELMDLLEISASYSKIALLGEIDHLISSMKPPSDQVQNFNSSLNRLQMSLQHMSQSTTMKLEGLLSKSQTAHQAVPLHVQQSHSSANLLLPAASPFGNMPKVVFGRLAHQTAATAIPLAPGGNGAIIPATWNWNLQAIGIPFTPQVCPVSPAPLGSQFTPAYARSK